MFYSHVYLARKGPLGTVWAAAHLQQRLKKSHYTATNIPKTVDLIMFPEAPLALRLSGHLLLGVVRIYSKQVDYLFRDCALVTTWLSKSFVSTQVDLPEDARQAPVESVTLPQALNLDDFQLDDDTHEGEFDNHLRSQEDITLTDQIPTGVDPYVAITFDEVSFLLAYYDYEVDFDYWLLKESFVCLSYRISVQDLAQWMSSESLYRVLISSTTHMLKDMPFLMWLPLLCDLTSQSTEPVSAHPGDTDVEMAFETEPLNLSPERGNANSPGSVPEVEIRRDAAAAHGLSPASHLPFATEHTEPLDETMKEKEPSIPNIDDEVLSSRGQAFELRSGSPGFAGFEEERDNFVHPSPQLALQPSPPPPAQQPRPRKRKHFDKVTVLTNRIMRERLEDPSDTLRKRKKMPSSKLSMWRMNNQSKKDQIFSEPLLTGFSDALRSVFDKDCVSSKPYLAVPSESIPEPAPVSSPTREAEAGVHPTSSVPQSAVPDSTHPDDTLQRSPVRQTEDVQDSAGPQSARGESVPREAQSPRPFNDDDTGIERFRDGGYIDFMPSPPPRFSPSSGTDDFTTQTSRASETESYRTEPSTSAYRDDMPGLMTSGISAIPEMADEELYFLDVGGNTPVRSPASQDSDALTGRTRALAQYLKERSSVSPSSSTSSGDLSLGKILEGKTRKLAARMFFETLVLKSRGLIDMHQEQPYSDITLKLMPGLFSKVPE
ncbi:hypothetical protein HID58_082573 [Brassica napus]|uniref:Sister chromatid cohesion 1 protein 3 n=1 Tax=Brassica napus TaxID=3708 RepID=A0ABQ7YCL8_BRANA|nr:hypothetical protein HID58_082573 [Brassica napus]